MFLVIALQFGREIEGPVSRTFRIPAAPFQQQAGIAASAESLFYIQCAHPRPQVATADEVVGDESRTADNPLRIQKEIPLGQGANGIQRFRNTIIVERLRHLPPAGGDIFYGLPCVFGMFPDGENAGFVFHVRFESKIACPFVCGPWPEMAGAVSGGFPKPDNGGRCVSPLQPAFAGREEIGRIAGCLSA